jgi:hypothetical protein
MELLELQRNMHVMNVLKNAKILVMWFSIILPAVVGVDATDDDIPPLEAAPEQMEIDAPAVPSDDEMDTEDIPNIRMVVLDGIVMGPQVNNFIFFLLSLFVHNNFFSTVHMTIVLMISLTLVVDHYVTYII